MKKMQDINLTINGIDDKRCLISSNRWTKELIDMFMNMPKTPRFKKGTQDLVFNPTRANIDYLKEHMPDNQIEWMPEAKGHLERYVAHLQREKHIIETKDDSVYDAVDDFEFKTEPFEHQRKAFYLSRELEYFALLMEQGTGKTKVIIDTAAYLYSMAKITTMIVIAPNGVHRNWINIEIPKHFPDWCPSQAAFYANSMNKKQKARLDAVANSKDCLKIFSFNVEGFVSEKAKTKIIELMDNEEVLLVVDESSKIKKAGNKRTRFIVENLRNRAAYRRILTGTPITRSIEDLYSQFKFLDAMVLGYDTNSAFKARYCNFNPYIRGAITGYKNSEELADRVAGSSFRVLKKDCTDLPPKVYQRHFVEISAKQKELYKTMQDKFVMELDEREVSATAVISVILRLQQILCGWFPEAEGEVIPIEESNTRINALKEVLGNIYDAKVIIWARFTADIRAIKELLGDEAVMYYGAVSNDDREKAVDSFQNDPKIKYFIGQPQSGGLGLTLTAATFAIYYSNSYDLEYRLQSEDRCHRIGTKSTVTYIDLECPGTIDSRIIEALRSKKNLADTITKDPKSLFLEAEPEEKEDA